MDDLLQPWHIIVVLFILSLYFVPVIVARLRNCKASAGIAVVNIFLGWTFIGWVAALAWAAAGESNPKITEMRQV